MQRWLVRAGLSVLLLGAATIVATRAYYPRFLYPAPHGDRNAPAEGTLLTVVTGDGVSAHATELAGPDGAPVIVYFHGNGVAMGDELWMAREPYTSIPEAASRFVFGLPTRLLMRERFDSLAKAPRVTLPTLIVHGTNDVVVPYAMGVKLAGTFPHARLITVQGGNHNDLFLGERWSLFDEVANFARRGG